MKKLAYIASDFDSTNPEEIFNSNREALGNLLGLPFADECIINTSKTTDGYTLTITGNHLDTTIYDSVVKLDNIGNGLLMINSVVNYDSNGIECFENGAFHLSRQLIELTLGIKPVVLDEKSNVLHVGVSVLSS